MVRMYGFDGKWEDIVFLPVFAAPLTLALGISDLGMAFFLGTIKLGKRKVRAIIPRKFASRKTQEQKDNAGGVLDLAKKIHFLQFRVDCWKNYC